MPEWSISQPLNKMYCFFASYVLVYIIQRRKRGESMLLEIDAQSQTPIYQQICHQLIIGIAKNKLKPGEMLPSVRQMADEIGVNMMTVSKAYTLLKSDGYILTDRRNGTKVAEKKSLDPLFQQRFLNDLELLLAEASIHQLSENKIQEEVKQIYKKFEQ